VRAINKVKTPKSVDLAEFSYYSWKDAKDSLTQEALQVVAPFIASDNQECDQMIPTNLGISSKNNECQLSEFQNICTVIICIDFLLG
jgi:hypothetical protein